MGLISWLLAITGAVGLAYGLNVVLTKKIQIYRKGEIHQYEGQPALVVGLTLMLAASGAVIMGAFGITPLTMAIGLAFSATYLVGRYFADRMEAAPDLSLPSKKNKK